MSKVVFTFGRFNPITIGHEKLANKVRAVARLEKGDAKIFMSHSQDKKKNPLDYLTKIKYGQKAFGKAVVRTKSNTIIKILQELEKNYTEVVLVVGSDRVESMKKLINDYNGKDYNFDTIKVVSAGERDPDADDVSGMSASKMRQLATDDDLDGFTKGLPKLLQRDAKNIMYDVRKGLKL